MDRQGGLEELVYQAYKNAIVNIECLTETLNDTLMRISLWDVLTFDYLQIMPNIWMRSEIKKIVKNDQKWQSAVWFWKNLIQFKKKNHLWQTFHESFSEKMKLDIRLTYSHAVHLRQTFLCHNNVLSIKINNKMKYCKSTYSW